MWKPWVFALCAVSSAAQPVRAAEISSSFIISKSENKNQVRYAVDVNDTCLPSGASPVKPYWRMLDHSATEVQRIKAREERYYGIAEQHVEGAAVRIKLRALPSRPITITTSRAANGSCVASATARINGKPARLYDIHVALNLFGVDHLLITGWSPDGAVVRERIDW